MQRVVVFKIGHKEGDPIHETGGGIFHPWLNSSDRNSPYYEPSNFALSEFSSIRQIVYELNTSKYSEAEYVGLCHYRCLIGDMMPFILDSSSPCYYKKLLKISEELILSTLNEKQGGIISTTYNPFGLKNYQQGPRWTGTKSIDYLLEVIEKYHPDYYGLFDKYLEDTQNSFKVACVLPREDFLRIFSLVSDVAQELIELRSSRNDLTPRSVGYELETLTSALLIHHWRTTKYVARIKHTVI